MERDRLIDGWRGVSVILVIVGHLVEFRLAEYFNPAPFGVLLAAPHLSAADLARNVVYRLLTPLPTVGVDMFFIISGYLITKLLLDEEHARGAISIKAFYVRRICRIFPAFFAYLAAMFALSALGWLTIPSAAFIWSGLFLCDVAGARCTWWMGHTWSLSVEEQFYLVWPWAFVMLGHLRRTVGLGVVLGALLALSFAYPLALSFAHIAIGGLCASSVAVKQKLTAMAGMVSMSIATAVILLQPFLASAPTVYAVVEAARPAMLAMIFFGTISGIGPYVGLISGEWLRRIGLASYSLYLWQQLSTGTPNLYAGLPLLLIPVVFVLPALLSYVALEKPMVRLGHRLSAAIAR